MRQPSGRRSTRCWARASSHVSCAPVHDLPEPIAGVSWSRLALEGASPGVIGHEENRAEIARATLTVREIAPGEWRATADIRVIAGPHFELAGKALLAWAERVTHALTTDQISSGASVILAVDVEAHNRTFAPLLPRAGLELAVAEHEMRRPTTLTEQRPFPVELTLRPWSEDAAPLFHHAYAGAFRDRPGFPGWDEAHWRAAFAAGDGFRPDLSVVVLEGAEPAAFAVLWVEEGTGWITQMGVRPAWRGKGLGEALLARALTAFAKEGIETAALEVATNNPAARALYERMGFAVLSGYESWRKTLSR